MYRLLMAYLNHCFTNLGIGFPNKHAIFESKLLNLAGKNVSIITLVTITILL